MPNSLRCKLKKLKHQNILSDKDCERLISALDKADVLDNIETAINKAIEAHKSMKWLGDYDRGFNAGMEHTIYLVRAVQDGDKND